MCPRRRFPSYSPAALLLGAHLPGAHARPNEDRHVLNRKQNDRYGEVPKETEHLRVQMALKTQMRKLKLRAMESEPGRLVVTLEADAALDPVRMRELRSQVPARGWPVPVRALSRLYRDPKMKLIRYAPSS